MRAIVIITLSVFVFSCQDTCNESECTGSSSTFSFRLVDENQNDLVEGPFARIDRDSVFVYGSNKGAISKLEKEVTIKLFDTIPVFQFSVDFVHTRYLIETRTASATVIDTLNTEYILDNSDCCNIELIEYQAIVNGDPICEQCQPETVHLFNR